MKIVSGARYRAKATGSVYEVRATTPTRATIKLHEWDPGHRQSVIAEAERSGERILIALQREALPFEVEHRWFRSAARKV